MQYVNRTSRLRRWLTCTTIVSMNPHPASDPVDAEVVLCDASIWMEAFFTLGGVDDLHLVCHKPAGHDGQHQQVTAQGHITDWSQERLSGPPDSNPRQPGTRSPQRRMRPCT